MFVYVIKNTINGKKYVGQTTSTVDKRWRKHVNNSNSGSSLFFHKAIRKYGTSAFEVETVYLVHSKSEMNMYEISLIQSLRTYEPEFGYNQTLGGEGALDNQFAKGNVLSAATRKRMSISHEGQKRTSEQCLNISKSKMGNKSCCGRIVSEDTRRKLRQNWKNQHGTNKRNDGAT